MGLRVLVGSAALGEHSDHWTSGFHVCSAEAMVKHIQLAGCRSPILG